MSAVGPGMHDGQTWTVSSVQTINLVDLSVIRTMCICTADLYTSVLYLSMFDARYLGGNIYPFICVGRFEL